MDYATLEAEKRTGFGKGRREKASCGGAFARHLLQPEIRAGAAFTESV